ncbi:MAG: hypothetical protein AB2L14_07695 [Candidatus Xenobiia bacterium LiM19]
MISRISEIVKPVKKTMRYAGKSTLFFLLSDKGVPLASIVRQNAYYGGALPINNLISKFEQKDADYPVQDDVSGYDYSGFNIQEIVDEGSQDDVIIQIISIGENSEQIMKNFANMKNYIQFTEEEEPFFYFQLFYYNFLKQEEELARRFFVPAGGKLLFETLEFDDGTRSIGLVFYPPKVKRIANRY